MHVFISWSGRASEAVAEVIREYLPMLFADVETFMSKNDIASGVRWGAELASRLESSSFGILCLARDNLSAPWLLFEAGALTKHANGRACGLLIGELEATEVRGPLAQFQHRQFSKVGVSKLIDDINEQRPNPIDVAVLHKNLEKWWPEIYERYQSALLKVDESSTAPERTDRDMIEETLLILRGLSASVRSLELRTAVQAEPDLGEMTYHTSILAARPSPRILMRVLLELDSESREHVEKLFAAQEGAHRNVSPSTFSKLAPLVRAGILEGDLRPEGSVIIRLTKTGHGMLSDLGFRDR